MPPKNKPTKHVVRLTDATDHGVLYINPGDVQAIKEIKPIPQFNNATTAPTNNWDTPHPDAKCWIYMAARFQVIEHIAVVTAILKGEDPAPAEVIFGDS